MKRALSWLLVALMGAGLAATLFWFDVTNAGEYARAHLPLLAGALALAVGCTTLNLGVRWARWHFLLRRFDIRVHTRDSVRLYFATLPALATPLSLGELVRAPLVAARFREAKWAVPLVWATERLTDATILGCVLLYVTGRDAWIGAMLVGWVALVSAPRLLAPSLARLSRPPALAVLLVATSVAWMLPLVALWGSLHLIGLPLSFGAAAGAFSSATLLGAATVIPLGTGVTGSAMILALEDAGLANQAAVVIVAVFRAGTAWYAVALGLATLLRSRRKLLAFVRPGSTADHFDRLAGDYGTQIPAHIRDRLLGRKVEVMRGRLAAHGIRAGARGLDVGCGQGWYATEMARAGYAMTAFDQSADQVAEARRHAASQGLAIDFAVLDASQLPYPDDSFDFAYSINVLHHIVSPGARERALVEIGRVLKPGGVFFLHEINTENPLFRLYMGYLFPLLCEIDEGTEEWIRPSALPPVEGAVWQREVDYFTFLPDFTPRRLLAWLRPLEARLERSRLNRWSAHFAAQLVKVADVSAGARGPGPTQLAV